MLGARCEKGTDRYIELSVGHHLLQLRWCTQRELDENLAAIIEKSVERSLDAELLAGVGPIGRAKA